MAMTYPQQPHPQYPPPPAPSTPPTQSRWAWRTVWIIAVVAAFIVGLAAGTGTDSGSTSARETVTVRVPAGEGDAPADTAAAEKPDGPVTTMGSGVYQVGVDVAPGQYKTAGPEDKDLVRGCYWARLKNDSGGLDAIIANGNLEGPGSFTINDGEFLELGGDCTWSKTG